MTLSILGLTTHFPKPASKDKERGIIACQRRLQHIYRGEDKIPGIYITSNCTRFRYEITRYSWDDWKKDTENTKGQKQKPVDKDDHMMENWYRLENAYAVYEESYDEYQDPEDTITEEIHTSPTQGGVNATTGY